MPETIEALTSKPNGLGLAVMLSICIFPVLDAVFGWSGIDGAEQVFIWIATPMVWAITVAGVLTRIRLDADGIELWSPIIRGRRIGWREVVSITDNGLAVGSMTVIHGHDGKTIAISNAFSNRGEMVHMARKLAGLPGPQDS